MFEKLHVFNFWIFSEFHELKIFEFRNSLFFLADIYSSFVYIKLVLTHEVGVTSFCFIEANFTVSETAMMQLHFVK